MNTICTRIGFGYDSHRLVPNEEFFEGKITICGVPIPNKMVFASHSDGDIAVHSLIDALLGATALGNIGQHFPDTDSKYKGADSMKLLCQTVELLKTKGFKIFNVDITIVLQKPKIADYVELMRENIAGALEIGKDFVSIKGKTNEKMDDVGAGVGAMTFATASVLQKVDLETF